MRAIRFHRHGGPEVLQLDQLPDPTPAPGEVVVRLTGRGVNRAEVLTVEGRYPRLPVLPAIIGREGAGVVHALGPDVGDFAVGQRVVLRLGTSIGSGTWCELVRVAAIDLLPTPARLDDAQAAAALVAYLTSWCSLREVLRLDPGSSVVVTAASSPTGLAALDICRHLGITAIATTRRAERIDVLRAAGATAVAVIGTDDLVELVRATTDGGASAAFDAVSGAVGTACYKALAEGGTLVQYGAFSAQPIEVNPGTLIFKQKRVVGFWITRVLEQWPRARIDAIYRELWTRFESGALTPRVHGCYPLAQAADALRAMNRMEHVGKVVLTS